jgi:transmembrane sensor
MNPEITKELLYEHFQGNVSARQRQLIDEWARRPENEELFYKYLMEWEIARPQYTVDVRHGIERFRENIMNSEEGYSNRVTPGRNSKKLVFLAAACVALVAFTFGWVFRQEIMYRELATQPGEMKSWVLDDGSKVSLNTNSALTVPRWGFGTDSREVYLKGEAEFVVTHRENGQRFVVKTADAVDVVVLGTEFTVYSRSDKTQILLAKGKVSVQHQNGQKKQEMLMAPGDRVTFDNGNIRQNHFDKPAEYATWKESRFVFNKTSLTEIARLLQSNYNLEVEIVQPELAELTVSGSFKALDHLELINSISQILDIQCKVKGKRVTFSQAE